MDVIPSLLVSGVVWRNEVSSSIYDGSIAVEAFIYSKLFFFF